MSRILKLAAFALALTTGCFDDPAAGESTGGETSACPDGSAGCDCYGNNTCNDDLLCEDGTCKAEECVAGSLNCDCYQGECFSALVCMDGTCKPEGAAPGCEATADCDGNLCTQGDQTCEQSCVAGIEVQCPVGASCDSGSGSCLCEQGSKPCGDVCVPESQCCTNTDCPAGSSCAEGFCTCDGGLMCEGQCVADVQCCPGEVSTQDCPCGGQRQCGNSGVWAECMGGNPNPECEAGQLMDCGNCGSRVCTAECTWTPCQGEGVCEPGEQNCINNQLTVCTESCSWMVGQAC